MWLTRIVEIMCFKLYFYRTSLLKIVYNLAEYAKHVYKITL